MRVSLCALGLLVLVAAASGPRDAASADPLAFGAKGDDATDDGPAFQRAVDALPPGGTLVLRRPPRKYAVASEVVIGKRIVVSGGGWDTIIRADSDRLETVFRVQGDGDGTELTNFRLEGSRNAKGGTPQRGIYFNGAREGLVRRVLFSGPAAGTGLNFGVVINGRHSNGARVLGCRFERLVSSSGNGTAVLIEASSSNEIAGNTIDGLEFGSADGGAGAAIFLSAFAGGDGSSDNRIHGNVIRRHRQAGIAVNSTTYFEFAGALGACDRNVIANNSISFCASPNGGDAASGIVVVGNSSSNRIVNNRIHHNGDATAGGYGILISGAQRGAAVPGEPKIDEAPDRTDVEGNRVYDNQDDGIRLKGARNTRIARNLLRDNGRRTPGTFCNVIVDGVGATATAKGTTIADNNLTGAALGYQIGIGPAAVDTVVENNFCAAAEKGVVNNLGVRSRVGPQAAAPHDITAAQVTGGKGR